VDLPAGPTRVFRKLLVAFWTTVTVSSDVVERCQRVNYLHHVFPIRILRLVMLLALLTHIFSNAILLSPIATSMFFPRELCSQQHGIAPTRLISIQWLCPLPMDPRELLQLMMLR